MNLEKIRISIKKISTTDHLKQIREHYQDYDLYASFTNVDKLDINPMSKFDTPLGIYAYDLDYVLSRGIKNLPYANDRNYINVFT